jgi:hypothetical protein
MNNFIKQGIKNLIASIKRRFIRALENVQKFVQIFGQSGSIFGLAKQVRIETDKISFKRQLIADRSRRTRNPSGF